MKANQAIRGVKMTEDYGLQRITHAIILAASLIVDSMFNLKVRTRLGNLCSTFDIPRGMTKIPWTLFEAIMICSHPVFAAEKQLMRWRYQLYCPIISDF